MRQSLFRLGFIVGVVLVIGGILISTLPVLSFYFSTYIHFTHYAVERGSFFKYWVEIYNITEWTKSKGPLASYPLNNIAMIVNVRVLGNNEVEINTTFPQWWLNNISRVLSSEDIKYFRPYVQMVNMSFPQAEYFFTERPPVLGPPVSPPDKWGMFYCLYTNTFYVIPPSGNYSYWLNTVGPGFNENVSAFIPGNFLYDIDPLLAQGFGINSTYNLGYLIYAQLISTNTAPAEDWSGYLWYGVLRAFPLNMALIELGLGVLLLIYIKRGR